jgi:hypothetical protein
MINELIGREIISDLTNRHTSLKDELIKDFIENFSFLEKKFIINNSLIPKEEKDPLSWTRFLSVRFENKLMLDHLKDRSILIKNKRKELLATYKSEFKLSELLRSKLGRTYYYSDRLSSEYLSFYLIKDKINAGNVIKGALHNEWKSEDSFCILTQLLINDWAELDFKSFIKHARLDKENNTYITRAYYNSALCKSGKLDPKDARKIRSESKFVSSQCAKALVQSQDKYDEKDFRKIISNFSDSNCDDTINYFVDHLPTNLLHIFITNNLACKSTLQNRMRRERND